MRMQKLAWPYILWMLVFTIAPLMLVAYYAFTSYDSSGNIYFTFEGFKSILSMESTVALDFLGLNSLFGIDLQVPIYINVFAKSLSLALVSTLICLLLGYPAAYILAQRSRKKQGSSFLLFMFVLPMWMNALLRTYAWLALLEPNGIINSFLSIFNVGPIQFLYNDFGIGLGMVYNYLPFMVLPIHSVLLKIDRSVVEAAEDLGADSRQTFARVIFPLSMPGIFSGINMVFMPAMTTFLIPDLLGGGRYLLIGNAIERQYMVSRDYTVGSALSIMLLVFVLASLRVLTRYEQDNSGGGVLG
ncbi:MAG: ABC transporter permease [Eubacteriales bacterium]|nr:ABC transporter permease [Eubacteriales bacterium]MDD3196812.1 ABC transporter permease [Eubacteriales bacterium]MDD3503051.1 ABC transporter permease [Eubacteriales bacterium]MDD4682538.1 ABC transporter permease [Eubacteriales bacterium]